MRTWLGRPSVRWGRSRSRRVVCRVERAAELPRLCEWLASTLGLRLISFQTCVLLDPSPTWQVPNVNGILDRGFPLPCMHATCSESCRLPSTAAGVPELAAQVPDVNGILDRLLLFLGYDKDFVTAESLIQASACTRHGNA